MGSKARVCGEQKNCILRVFKQRACDDKKIYDAIQRILVTCNGRRSMIIMNQAHYIAKIGKEK